LTRITQTSTARSARIIRARCTFSFEREGSQIAAFTSGAKRFLGLRIIILDANTAHAVTTITIGAIFNRSGIWADMAETSALGDNLALSSTARETFTTNFTIDFIAASAGRATNFTSNASTILANTKRASGVISTRIIVGITAFTNARWDRSTFTREALTIIARRTIWLRKITMITAFIIASSSHNAFRFEAFTTSTNSTIFETGTANRNSSIQDFLLFLSLSGLGSCVSLNTFKGLRLISENVNQADIICLTLDRSILNRRISDLRNQTNAILALNVLIGSVQFTK